MEKRNIITSICLFMFIFFSGNLFPSSIKAENFPVYNIKGNRFVFYKILDSLPEKGMLIVNFTSVNCKPCKKEIPELKQIASIKF